MYRPDFDSPSVFGRMIDRKIGGHFTIGPKKGISVTTKQQYLPSSNVLQTRHLNEDGVLNIIDFFPATNKKPSQEDIDQGNDTRKWFVRRVECIRGAVDVEVEVLPVSLTMT
jgi:GH15 family glucan-1,4-alpha-glucosidase